MYANPFGAYSLISQVHLWSSWNC